MNSQTPSDKALAQALREVEADTSSYLPRDEFCDMVRDRARELDAEKGGEWKEWSELERFVEEARESFLGHPSSGIFRAIGKKLSAMTTPPAQSAEAVERVARAIFGNKWMSPRPGWETLHESTRDEYRAQARAAIAAMQAGEDNK